MFLCQGTCRKESSEWDISHFYYWWNTFHLWDIPRQIPMLGVCLYRDKSHNSFETDPRGTFPLRGMVPLSTTPLCFPGRMQSLSKCRESSTLTESSWQERVSVNVSVRQSGKHTYIKTCTSNISGLDQSLIVSLITCFPLCWYTNQTKIS